ncbi:peptidoglycan-binding domain-containing protein [Streptomyces lasiicapitis]|uniref:peptidoglycan-binding domain-containing protein n=1 Tax=Streptomyces lasiicapitis TaxID=1923961 RepID=UPI00166C3FF6|nr:peptidoglycan-binding domain-containing protein [Streptomyces lasiicapitis]
MTLPEPSAPLPALTSTPLPPEAPAAADTAPAEASPAYERSARRVRTGLFAGAGAVFAAVAVFAGGALSGGNGGGDRGDGSDGTTDRALPDTAADTPDAPSGEPAPRKASPPAPRPTSSHAAPTPTRTPSASASRSLPVRNAPVTSPSRSTARATGSVGPAPSSRRPTPTATLRLGDQGDDVTELQYRLRQLFLYVGPPDGTYTRPVADAVTRYQWARGVTTDPHGTYGPKTRKSLESETNAP